MPLFIFSPEFLMPYASAKQRGFMHIHHPEIAKKWDEEERKKKAKKKKSAKK